MHYLLLFMANSVPMVVVPLCHPPLHLLPSREGKLKKFPLPLWERVRVRGKNLNNF